MTARLSRDQSAHMTRAGDVARERVIALRPADHVALAGMEHALLAARGSGDARPPFAILADSLCDLGVELPRRPQPTVPLDEARDEWLRRLRSANRSASSIAAQPGREGGPPFLCIAGAREYHDHPGHSGDSWDLHRDAGAGRLVRILDVIDTYGVRPITGFNVQLQPLVAGYTQNEVPA